MYPLTGPDIATARPAAAPRPFPADTAIRRAAADAILRTRMKTEYATPADLAQTAAATYATKKKLPVKAAAPATRIREATTARITGADTEAEDLDAERAGGKFGNRTIFRYRQTALYALPEKPG